MKKACCMFLCILITVLLFVVGVWVPFKRVAVGKILGALGVVGIVISEIYKFFTWHILNITGEMSFRNSIEFAFPAFYFGLAVSLAMVVVYFIIDRIVKEN